MPLLEKPASQITSEICDDVKGFSDRLLGVLKNSERMEDELNLHRKVKTEVVGLLQEAESLTRTCFNISKGTIVCMQDELMASRKHIQESSVSADSNCAKRIKFLEKKNAKAEEGLTLSLKREEALKLEVTKLKKKNKKLENELSRQNKKQDLLSPGTFSADVQDSSSLFELSHQNKKHDHFSTGNLSTDVQDPFSLLDFNSLSNAGTPEMQRNGMHNCFLMTPLMTQEDVSRYDDAQVNGNPDAIYDDSLENLLGEKCGDLSGY